MTGPTPAEKLVEEVAVALWAEEARRAAPNVVKYRTVEMFREQQPELIRRWLGSARAAIAVVVGKIGDRLQSESDRLRAEYRASEDVPVINQAIAMSRAAHIVRGYEREESARREEMRAKFAAIRSLSKDQEHG